MFPIYAALHSQFGQKNLWDVRKIKYFASYRAIWFAQFSLACQLMNFWVYDTFHGLYYKQSKLTYKIFPHRTQKFVGKNHLSLQTTILILFSLGFPCGEKYLKDDMGKLLCTQHSCYLIFYDFNYSTMTCYFKIS